MRRKKSSQSGIIGTEFSYALPAAGRSLISCKIKSSSNSKQQNFELPCPPRRLKFCAKIALKAVFCYDFSMTYEYCIVSRWRNKDQVTELANKIHEKGKTVYSFIEGDGIRYALKDHEQKYEPEEFMRKYESIPDWRNDPAVREIFEADMKALKNSDTVILLLPAGKSSHIEAGVAYGLGKKLILIGEQKETESLYLIFDEFYKSTEDFISGLGAKS